MRNRLLGSVLAVGAVLASAPVILAQTAPPPGAPTKAAPDLSGFWNRPGFHPEIANPDGSALIPPMQPWAAELYNARRTARDENSKLAIDPEIACLPPGIPRSYFGRSAFDLYQAPGRVIMIFEANNVGRIIYTDGRGHPEGAPPAFMGHSIGRWDGDTLLVETIGLRGNDETWLDRSGHPHTEALRLVERLRRVSHDTLEIDLLVDDPKAYTKPWGGKVSFRLTSGWELMDNFICMDHFAKDHLPEIRRLTKEFSKP